MADGFLGRWSRRKLDVKEGRVPEEPPRPRAPAGEGAGADSTSVAGGARGGEDAPAAAGPAAPAPVEPPPTVEDTRCLTPDSDFTRFVRRDVPPEVRNAAVKKLFADPHFNVMDGLDVYIDDYGKPDPLPESAVRQLASVQFLGLFREQPAADEVAQAARDDAEGPRPATVAQSPQGEAADDSPEPPPGAGPDHGHADLRLQPDDAAGPPEPGTGTGREAGAA